MWIIFTGITLAYRLIPARIRRLWSLGTPVSTSADALNTFWHFKPRGMRAVALFMFYAVPRMQAGGASWEFYYVPKSSSGPIWPSTERQWTGVNKNPGWNFWGDI